MDKPTCRLCGAKHYAREPHALKGAPSDVPMALTCNPCRVKAIEIARLRARIAELEGLVADPVSSALAPSVSSSVSKPVSTDRKEYMRNLMRAKRAKAKGA